MRLHSVYLSEHECTWSCFIVTRLESSVDSNRPNRSRGAEQGVSIKHCIRHAWRCTFSRKECVLRIVVFAPPPSAICTRHNGECEANEEEMPLVFEGPLGNPRASGPLTQHNAQSRHAPHFSLCCSSAVQVLSLEPNPARLEAPVHSSLVLKHFTAGEH